MSGFADQMMLRFLDDPFTTDFLNNKVGAAALFNTCYTPVDFLMHNVTVSQVMGRQFESPTFETIRSTGTEEKVATSERTMSSRSFRNFGKTVWVDVIVPAVLSVQVESTVLAPDSIITQELFEELGGAATIAELQTKLLTQFTQSQVDAIFTQLQISTIEEFKARMNLFVTFKYKAPPAFNPEDPAATLNFPLTVCVRFQPTLDVSDALQNAKLCRSIREQENQTQPSIQGADVKSPFVFVTVFPDSVAIDNAIPGMTGAQIKTGVQSLFGVEGMLANFFVT